MTVLEYDVDDFLEHFGVKGMRWGHRKQVANEKLRTKLAGKASTEVSKGTQAVKDGDEGLKSLKKDGENSNLYKAMKERAFVETANNLIRKGYDPYSAKLNALIMTSDYDAKAATVELKYIRDQNEAFAKDWTSRNQKLMNMDMASVKKKDIKRAYQGK